MIVLRKPIVVYLCFYIVNSAFFPFTLALSKTWIQDNNWETLQNWNLQRLPCADDLVKMDLANTAVYLNSTATIKELTFPTESSIVLGDSAEIVFADESDFKSCEGGGEISFTGSGSSDWFDPNNWQTELKLNDIGLYSKQLPCQYDTVIFPKDSSYNVKITRNVTVANIALNGKEHNENEFKQFVTSHTGAQQIQLKNSSSFRITGKECQDSSGCICDNNEHEDYICSFVTCPKLKCDQPVKPFGGCCSICGSLLLLNVSAGFNKNTTEKRIQEYLKKFPETIFTSTKYEEHRIQVILWDISTYDNPETIHAARSIRENLLADKTMLIFSIELLPKAFPGSVESSKSKGVDAITIGAIIAGVLAFLMMVILVLYIFVRHRPARYEVNVSNQESRNEQSHAQNLYLEDGVNPLYESDLEMSALGFINALTTQDGEITGAENPLYEVKKSTGGD